MSFSNKKRKNLHFWLFVFLSVVLFFLFLNFKLTELDRELIRLNRANVVSNGFGKKEGLNLFFAGDIMLDRGVEYMIEGKGFGDYGFPFFKIKSELEKADVLFGNLEGPVSDRGQKVGSIYSFRSEPEAVNGLVFGGFNVLSLANNHIFDYGRNALEDTLLRLREAGIEYVGAGVSKAEAYSSLIKEINGTKIAYLAYTNLGSEYWRARNQIPGLAWLEQEEIKDYVRRTKEISDIVIVSFHYGMEYEKEPSLFQKTVSRLAIDSGADLVVGHHPHVVQPVEKYNQGYIAYSLGNFVFDQGFSEETTRGILLEVLVEDKSIKKVVPVDVKINDYFQPELVSE